MCNVFSKQFLVSIDLLLLIPPPILHMPSDAPHTFPFLLRRTTYPPPSLCPLTLHILPPFPFRWNTYFPCPIVPSYAPHTPPPPPPPPCTLLCTTHSPPPPCTLLCTVHSPSPSPLNPLMHHTLPLPLPLVPSCAPHTPPPPLPCKLLCTTHSSSDMLLISLEMLPMKDNVEKARGAYLIHNGKTLSPRGLNINRRDKW